MAASRTQRDSRRCFTPPRVPECWCQRQPEPTGAQLRAAFSDRRFDHLGGSDEAGPETNCFADGAWAPDLGAPINAPCERLQACLPRLSLLVDGIGRQSI